MSGAAAIALAQPQTERVAFEPQRRADGSPGPQSMLLECPVEDILFGGARGGGKTYGMLLDWLDHAIEHGRYATGVFFRRVYKNLEEVIADAHRIFPGFGGKWEASSGTYIFRSGPASGARLKFRHLFDVTAAQDYQGHAYTWICAEELTQWPTPDAIDMVRATLRSGYGVRCVFRATANPGGPGHNWVKARYISPAPLGFKVLTDPETGEQRVFIPSLLEDNRILMESDPTYEARLKRTGPPALVRAWRFGDWDIVAGGYFDDLWTPHIHILSPFALPAGWTRRRSFDWGSAKPASLGMWAISDGTQPVAPGRVLPFFPRGTFIRFGEWYAAERDESGLVKPNVGLRLSNTAMGAAIAERSHGHNWSGDVADPSIFTEQGGPSIYAQLRDGARQRAHMLNWEQADNDRVAGWQRVRDMLDAARLGERELPGLYVFDNCTEFVRTVPVLQADKKKPDDVDTDGEDHTGDETRYAVMSQGSGATFGSARVRG